MASVMLPSLHSPDRLIFVKIVNIRRYPQSVYRAGEDPDPRFSLANERTFLAWSRTALALMACGIALDSLAPSIHDGFRFLASLILIASGTVVAIQAWRGWANTERALRMGNSLPSPRAFIPLIVILTTVSLCLLLGILL